MKHEGLYDRFGHTPTEIIAGMKYVNYVLCKYKYIWKISVKIVGT